MPLSRKCATPDRSGMMPPMVRALGLVAGALFVAGAIGSTAEAQERARLHFQAGASYYEAGDYEDALREFERAFELSEEPKLYYNFSLCHQQLGRLEEAADALERYLQQVEDVDNRGNLERRLLNLRERAATRAAQSPGDDETTGGGGTDDRPATPDAGISPIAIAGFAAAGAGAVMLGVFGGLALGERSELDDDPCSATRTCDASGLRTKAVLADVGLGLLVVGAALGTVFLFVGGDDDEDDASARFRLSPAVGPRGAALSAQGVF